MHHPLGQPPPDPGALPVLRTRHCIAILPLRTKNPPPQPHALAPSLRECVDRFRLPANPSEDGTFFTTYNDYFTFSEPGYDADVGPSFAVAISGLFLAIAVAILLCLFARHAGEGPLYSCCSSLMLANRTAGGTHKVEGGDRSSAPAPSQHIPTATAMGTAAAPAATAEPQHHYEEAGLPPPPQPASGPAEGERKQQEELPAYDALPPAKS